MFVKNLTYEDLTDVHGSIKEVENPTWDEIREVILGLNGDTRSTITIARDPEEGYMGIGGGAEDGLYICFICSYLPDEDDWTLCDPSKSADQYVKIMAGQLAGYALRSCVDLNSVLKAAEIYGKFGSTDQSLCWDKL